MKRYLSLVVLFVPVALLMAAAGCAGFWEFADAASQDPDVQKGATQIIAGATTSNVPLIITGLISFVGGLLGKVGHDKVKNSAPGYVFRNPDQSK